MSDLAEMMSQTHLPDYPYSITEMPTQTRHTSAPSYLVFNNWGVFIAMFAVEQDARDYVAFRTAVDAGLERQRALRGMIEQPLQEFMKPAEGGEEE